MYLLKLINFKIKYIFYLFYKIKLYLFNFKIFIFRNIFIINNFIIILNQSFFQFYEIHLTFHRILYFSYFYPF